jgi:hypothetical protein
VVASRQKVPAEKRPSAGRITAEPAASGANKPAVVWVSYGMAVHGAAAQAGARRALQFGQQVGENKSKFGPNPCPNRPRAWYTNTATC